MNTLSRREVLHILAAAAAVRAVQATSDNAGAAPVVAEKIRERYQALPFESQHLGGLLAERMQVNVERALLRIDETAYLAGFVNRPVKAVPEDHPALGAAWVGEHVGKWLDAASNALRYSPNVPLRELADRTASALIATQAPDGYLGTYAPNHRWTAWDVWTHKYNLIGLLSYHELSGDAAVLAACRKMGDLLVRTFGDAPCQRDIAFNARIVPDLKTGTVAGIESTSILEPICKLYRFTGDHRYLEFARYIVRAYEQPGAPDVVRRPIDGNDVARGKAYEMLSNLVGLVDLYRLTGDEALVRAVLRDWEDIHRHQLYITGTASSNENFQPPDRLLSLSASGAGENCVSVTWLQLNERLLRLTGEARFGQEIERTVYNQLLAAQDPITGGINHFTSLTGKKAFHLSLDCCVSSGRRGLALLPSVVWGLEDEAFVVNLYTTGQASFERAGVRVRAVSQTSFPRDGTVSFTFDADRAVPFVVRLRVPEWTARFVATVGSQKYRGTAAHMLDISRTWQRGDTIHIDMDMPTRVLSGDPTYPDYVALQRGPQVLAMERRLNPDVPFLHRVALRDIQSPKAAEPVAPSTSATGPSVYAVDALVGVPDAAGNLNPQPRKVLFVPFAEATEYRVWMARPDRLRGDTPAVTAFASAAVSPDRIRPLGNRLEALTDENPRTFCTCDPRDFGGASIKRGSLGKRGEPVSFIVMLDEPTSISRIVFRHGEFTARGGWFDTSKGAPAVAVLRKVTYWKDADGKDTPYPDLEASTWEKIALLDSYPSAGQSHPPDLKDGQPFDVRLARPEKVRAIKIIGKPGGDYATCAELSAYA